MAQPVKKRAREPKTEVISWTFLIHCRTHFSQLKHLMKVPSKIRFEQWQNKNQIYLHTL